MQKYGCSIDIQPDRIRDLVVNAVEGGISYWCEEFSPFYIDIIKEKGRVWYDQEELYTKEFSIKIILRADDDFNGKKEFYLHPAGINKGLQIMAEKYSWHLNNIIQENDDAETADVFIQLAIFDEIVYG